MPYARTPPFTLIGLATDHELRPDSLELVNDDAAFAPVPFPWLTADEYVDSEIAQLSAGLRRVIKAELGMPVMAQQVAQGFELFGFVTRAFIEPGNASGAEPRAIVFAGRTLEDVVEACETEKGLVGGSRERAPFVRKMGALLGYPDCCVEAYADAPSQDDATHIARLSEAHEGRLAPEQNWTWFRLFSHTPCKPSCAKTARLGRGTLEAIARMNPTYAAKLEASLRSVAIIVDFDCSVQLPDARPIGPEAYAYSTVISHRLIPPSPLLQNPRFRAFYLEVIAPLEYGNLVRREGRKLIVEMDGAHVATITFANAAPRLLDFTAERAA